MDKELIIEHDKKEKYVVKFLTDIATETNIIYLKDEKGNDRISLRIQMIVIFSLIDVLASYWYEYQNKNGSPGERFRNWYDQYCKVDRNEEFCKNKQWTELNSTRIYKFRSSIVHFFGLSEETDNLYIILSPNNWFDIEAQKLFDKMKQDGHNTIILKPHEFYDLIREGAKLMLKDWIDAINMSKLDEVKGYKHIEGIRRIWNKINTEGAEKIPLDPLRII